MTHLVVAIDGPSASGKGTLARHLASTLHLHHLDTGLLYRAVGFEAHKRGLDLSDASTITEVAHALTPEDLQNIELRREDVAALASQVAIHPSVRQALLDFQRQFAAHQPAVLDGRDIGSVVLPDAPVKFFVLADAEVRAQRRVLELQEQGRPANYEEILHDIQERDHRDSTRAIAPLRATPDAHLIDTSHQTPHEALAEALAHIKRLGF